MAQRGASQQPDGPADILWLIDRLEELVSHGKRVPFGGRVMIEDQDFLGMIDELKAAVPNEIRQAQRVIRDRERIVSEAQDEAADIVRLAQERAGEIVSEHAIVNEARLRSEAILRATEEEQQRTRGELDVFILEQLQLVEDGVRRGMAVMEGAVERTLDEVQAARDAVGR